MSIFGARKQIETLEQEVLSNPTPQNMVLLVERYVAAGDEGRALDVARRAIERFPESEQCITTYQNLRKLQLQSEIQELNRTLRKHPTGSHYERLANLYLVDLNNRNKAFEVTMEGLTRFPNNDGLHLISGKIRMDRYHRDFLANDFTEAARHFEEARRNNPANTRAGLFLGRLYAEVGAFPEAQAVLQEVLGRDTSTPYLEELMAKIAQHAGQKVEYLDDTLTEIERRRGLPPLGNEILQLFEPTRAPGQMLQISPAKIEQFLQGYYNMSGYQCSAVLSHDGKILSGHSRGEIARERFSEVAQAIYQTALLGSKQMDIGAFVGGELDTPVGLVLMAAWRNMVLIILATHSIKKDELSGAVEKFYGFAAVG